MSERKATPDVLASLLNSASTDETAPVQTAPDASPARKPAKRKAGSAQKPRTAATSAVADGTTPARSPIAAPELPVAPLQWEYREVVFREFRGWRPRVVDGRERWDWKEAPLLLDYLHQAGGEGWELVSIGAEHNFEKTAYFKRPKV